MGLYEGFVVVSGRVWKEITLCWRFFCKMHGRLTACRRGLEARKVKSREGNLVTDRQCNVIKVRRTAACMLSYKGISNGSNEKEYIGSLRYLEHTHPIYLNFSLKVHDVARFGCYPRARMSSAMQRQLKVQPGRFQGARWQGGKVARWVECTYERPFSLW
jgi:hypothetical protein